MRSRLLLAAVALVLTACGEVSVGRPSATNSAQLAGALPARPVTTAPSAAARPSPSATPDPAGSIAFMREDRPDHWELWTACADLTRATQLTRDARFQSGWPAWSPDGTRIAFNTNRDDQELDDGQDVWDIYTTNRNGDDLVKLTTSVGASVDPAYSADGKLIAFGWDVPGKRGIFVMNAADGGNVRQVTTVTKDAMSDIGPRFSPDGRRIVFTRLSGDSDSALYLVNLDGSGLRRITPATVTPDAAKWSPDGTQIVFAAVSRGFPFESIWIASPIGGRMINLFAAGSSSGVKDGYSDPVWSPDGSLILLEHGLHFEDGSVTAGLATIRPDGSGLRYVTDGLGAEDKPDWTAAQC
jgi:TolB protein